MNRVHALGLPVHVKPRFTEPRLEAMLRKECPTCVPAPVVRLERGASPRKSAALELMAHGGLRSQLS
eukprot:6398794-Amphidinium_carterae.1